VDPIKSVRAVPRTYRLRSPFTFASSTLSELPYAIVRIETESGLVGYGEAPAYWDPTGESQGSVLGTIGLFGSALVDVNALSAEGAARFLDRVSRGAWATRMAIECALLDITGKHYGVPAYLLLGGCASNGRLTVPLNAVIPLADDDGELREVVSRVVEEGFRYVKVKLSGEPTADEHRAKIVSGALPNGVRWFGDANQAWASPKDAVNAIRRLEHFEPVFIEQPIAADDLVGLAYVTRESPVKIAADESVLSTMDVINILAYGTVDMVNIKLAKTGGPLQARVAAGASHALRRPFVLGSMVEGALGMLANYHFGIATTPLCAGLTAHWVIDDREDVGLSIRDGEIVADNLRPGLGYPDAGVFEGLFS